MLCDDNDIVTKKEFPYYIFIVKEINTTIKILLVSFIIYRRLHDIAAVCLYNFNSKNVINVHLKLLYNLILCIYY